MTYRTTLSRIATSTAVVMIVAGAAVPVFAQSNANSSSNMMRPSSPDQTKATPATSGKTHHKAKHAMKHKSTMAEPAASNMTPAQDKTMKTGG